MASRQARPQQKVKKVDSVAAPSGSGKKKRLGKVNVSYCLAGTTLNIVYLEETYM